VPTATEANLKVYAPSGSLASAGGIWTTCQLDSRHSSTVRNPETFPRAAYLDPGLRRGDGLFWRRRSS